MSDDFLKPPSPGMWLVLAMFLSACAVAFFGEAYEIVAGCVFILGGLTAISVIARWLGRLIGMFFAEISAGFREGFERSRARRAEQR